MKPSKRTLKKWRKDSPKKHRSYAEKRDRQINRQREADFEAVKWDSTKFKNYKWI